MTLRIWCNSKYFPADVQELAIATATAILEALGVTLEQVRLVQAHIDRAVDCPQEGGDAAEGNLHAWEEAWFAAIAAGEAAADIAQTPIGAMLVLDGSDARFGGQ